MTPDKLIIVAMMFFILGRANVRRGNCLMTDLFAAGLSIGAVVKGMIA